MSSEKESKNVLIDTCCTWMEERTAAFLAKENVVTYFDSPTGRKSDYSWIHLSALEAIRIISSTRMSPWEGAKLKPYHLITAAQEMGRVYEYGIKTRHPTKSSVFNYTLEASEDLVDSIMSSIVTELLSNGYRAVLMVPVLELFEDICIQLNTGCSMKDRQELLHKHFGKEGYIVRTDSDRPNVKGTKRAVIMMCGTRPRDVVDLLPGVSKEIALRIWMNLK